ncbi:MAG: CsbD-like [Gammaproteobacteria bacterium]|nr:CsbD-like [Gammaproteobacteria bacterium]
MTMNKNLTEIVKGNWDELKGSIKKQWKLSNEDLDQIDGSYEELVGKLKKLYGKISDDEIKEKIQSILEDSGLDDIKNKIQEKIEKAFKITEEKFMNMEEDVIKYIKNNPVKSIVFTTIAGALLASFCFNKKK